VTEKRNGRFVPAILIAAVGVAAAGFAIMRSEALPGGPEEVVWDRTQCAECRMSVSERPYAAQLQTKDGQVLNFDDPGCLFQYERHNQILVHAIYYRHVREDRWLAEAEAGFIESGPSPMGYDLGAVAAGTAGALTATEVRAQGAPPATADTGEDSHAH
jgi:copper chaperone NosL